MTDYKPKGRYAVLLFLARLGAWLSLVLHLYRLKSWVHRWVFERGYKHVSIKTFKSLRELPAFIHQGALYRHDSWVELFDAVTLPQRAQGIFEGGIAPESNLDCDDHAIFLVAAIQESIKAGSLLEDVSNPSFFIVSWMENDNSLHGHAVCLFEMKTLDGKTQYAYMDYGMPSLPRFSIDEVAADIRKRYGGEETALIVWSTNTIDLKPLKVKWG